MIEEVESWKVESSPAVNPVEVFRDTETGIILTYRYVKISFK